MDRKKNITDIFGKVGKGYIYLYTSTYNKKFHVKKYTKKKIILIIFEKNYNK